jgi:hypothetical protein
LITEEQTRSIAKEECARRGWLWNPGLKSKTKPEWDFWLVYTPWKGMGMGIYIDRETGEVTRASRWPR